MIPKTADDVSVFGVTFENFAIKDVDGNFLVDTDFCVDHKKCGHVVLQETEANKRNIALCEFADDEAEEIFKQRQQMYVKRFPKTLCRIKPTTVKTMFEMMDAEDNDSLFVQKDSVPEDLLFFLHELRSEYIMWLAGRKMYGKNHAYISVKRYPATRLLLEGLPVDICKEVIRFEYPDIRDWEMEYYNKDSFVIE